MAQVLSPGAVPDTPYVAPKEAWSEKLQVRVICRDCREDPPELLEDHASGDLICANCGLVLQQRSIDTSSEWRTFSNDDQGNDDPSRVGDGPNALLNGGQLDTSIAYGDGGMRSKELHRAQNKATLDKGNKSLQTAYKHITTWCDNWSLPAAITDTAKHIYKDADESRIFKGKSMDALAAGCIFLACRRNNVQRTFREVVVLTRVSKKEIGRTFKMLEKFLLEKAKQDSRRNGIPATVDPATQGGGAAEAADLCVRFCSKLNMDHRTEAVATLVAISAQRIGVLAGRSPLSVAASCIFVAGHLMGQPKTPKEIQNEAGVSDSTIRHAYKLLYAARDDLLTDEILNRGADPSKLPKPA